MRLPVNSAKIGGAYYPLSELEVSAYDCVTQKGNPLASFPHYSLCDI